jgi:SP family sugar:H+ symporter-like MFS transporter
MKDLTHHGHGNNTSLIILISCIATIGGFLFGFDSGVINGTVKGLQSAFNSDSMGTGFSVSSMLLGCAAGAFFAGPLADRYGRRVVLIVAAVFFIVSAWGSGIATSSFEFIIYRVLGGFAVGAASIICPAYISEVAPARYRGRLISVQQIAIIVGLTAAFLSNYFLAEIAGSSTSMFWLEYETWRWMFWVELVPAFIFFFALFLIPESPRFLVASGQTDAALKVLIKLYGPTEGAVKMTEISDSLAADHHKPRFSDLIDKVAGRVRPIVWVGVGLAVLQQMVGINVVFYYGAVLWEAAGFSESDALLINVVSGAVSIAACFITFALVDKIGRKPLLWIGSAGMTVTLSLVVFAFAGAPLDANGNLMLSDNMGVLALVAANLYVVFFNVSWGPVMWIMLGEMFPNQIRGSGLAVAGFAQWIANFLITLTFPILLASFLGLAGTYSIYALCSALSVVFVLLYVKETKGKELEEMEG